MNKSSKTISRQIKVDIKIQLGIENILELTNQTDTEEISRLKPLGTKLWNKAPIKLLKATSQKNFIKTLKIDILSKY